MCEAEKYPLLKKMHVNLRYLSIKLHFFFFYGGLGAVMPFLPVIAKDLGITATAVGAVYTFISFAIIFAKPIFGAVADYVQNVKIVLIALICVSLVSSFAVLYIPPIQNTSTDINIVPSFFKCNDSSLPNNISQYNYTCLTDLFIKYKTDCNSNQDHLEYGNGSSLFDIHNISDTETVLPTWAWQTIDNTSMNNLSCSCNNFNLFFTRSNTCLLKDNKLEKVRVYKTFQFWVYAVLVTIFGSCTSSTFSLSDTACYEILEDKSKLYGRQRLWGTISWGCATLFTGYLNDVVSSGSSKVDYSPGFYFMTSLIFIDLIILYFSTLKKRSASLSIFKDVSRVFVSLEIVIFAVGVFVIGGLTALIWQFQFWFLQDLGASQLLLGLTIAVQCLAAEVPFFFISGKVIDTLGHMICLILSFVAYAIRFALYFYLTNPWWVLPIEILHGLTYGIFYATMTSFANSKSPPGTEATMLGILGGLFEGLGVAAGSLLGGIGFDVLKGAHTYLTASILSAICSIILCLIHYIPILMRTKKCSFTIK